MLCHTTKPVLPDVLIRVTKLVPPDNACPTGISSLPPQRQSHGFGMVRVVDSVSRHTRQTASALVDVGSAELYSGVGSCQLGFGIAEARQPAYLGQHHLSRQAASDLLFMNVGVESVHALSWTHPIGLWVQAPQATATTGLPPDAFVEHRRRDFIPEAQAVWPPVESVEASQPNCITS